MGLDAGYEARASAASMQEAVLMIVHVRMSPAAFDQPRVDRERRNPRDHQ
jgi:hypothetical protein